MSWKNNSVQKRKKNRGGRRSRRRKKRTRKKGGNFFKTLACLNIASGKQKPIGETEKKCCCAGYTCSKKYPNECRGFIGKFYDSLKENISDKIETRKDNAEKKKREKVYKYHTTRERNKGEPHGLYGSHCVNSKGEKWGWKRALKGERDWDSTRGRDYLNPDGTAKAQICPAGSTNCSVPANNIKYVPIQHRTNWTAPSNAFEKPTPDYKPGEVRDDGLVCRPDWGEGPKWEGEWCLLDPVGFSLRGKKNTEKANRQTCLTKYAKNWKASRLAAMAEGKYFDDEAQAAAIDSAYKKDYWHPNNMVKRIRKEREEEEAAKKKLVDAQRGGRRRRKTRRKGGGVINKISIPINWDSDDCGYKILRNKKVKTFLSQNFKKGNNLIQTFKPFKGNGRTTLHLRAIPVKSWPIKISWREIKCKHYKNWLKATPCDWGSTRIFAKLKSNKKIAAFGLYLDKLIKGKISKKKHIEFVSLMKEIMGNKPIQIHNEEVDWFHIKEA